MARKTPEKAAQPKPKATPKPKSEPKPQETFDITSKDFLGVLVDHAEARARVIGDAVNPTNIFVLRYMALGENLKEIIKLMDERGHNGIPTEAE